MTDAAATPSPHDLPPPSLSEAGARSAPAASTRTCAFCHVAKPVTEFDGARKNCRPCAASADARRKPRHAKPEGWVAPAPGAAPTKACNACRVSKVWSAFPQGSDTCRACAADEAPTPQPEAEVEGKRPVIYTPEIGAIIAGQVAGDTTLKAIAARPDMPSRDTLARWRLEHEDFAVMLATARQARADSRADEIAELVEAVRTGRVDPQAGRVAIDGLRWLASKDDPRRFGDKIELNNPDGSLKSTVNAAVAIEALISALPDLVGAASKELLPPPAAVSGGAVEAAGVSSAPAASVPEPAPSATSGDDDLDLSDDLDGYETSSASAEAA